MFGAIESGDSHFETQFQIDFQVKTFSTWDSEDNPTRTLRTLFDEVRAEVKPDRSIYNVMAAFTNQPTPCPAWGWAEVGTWRDGWTLGDNIIVTREAGGFMDEVVWHEFSHIFGCLCGPNHPPGCIMRVPNWTAATGWCADCAATITANKWVRFVW